MVSTAMASDAWPVVGVCMDMSDIDLVKNWEIRCVELIKLRVLGSVFVL